MWSRSSMVLGSYPRPCNRSRTSSSSSSSTTTTLAETIASIEELLTEILVRLPARPLLRFKCVSKHWHSLISDPKFCHRHTLQNPNFSISAVFAGDFSFIPFPLDHDHSTPLNFTGNQYDGIKVIHSCNGLLLCRPIGATSTSRTPYFVVNPTTNQFLTLTVPPVSEVETHIICCALAFDPSKSPHYKVICLDTIVGSIFWYHIQIYSSETRSWRLLNFSTLRQSHILYKKGVYCNGAIHWVGLVGAVSYFHIDEERVGYVNDLPFCCQKIWSTRIPRYFKESSGHLHLIDINATSRSKIEVLEMRRDYSGWFVKYHVDLDPICTNPRFLYQKFVVLFLTRDKNEEEGSSSLLLHFPGKVFSCNLKSKSFKSFELTKPSLLVGKYKYPYMDTLACV